MEDFNSNLTTNSSLSVDMTTRDIRALIPSEAAIMDKAFFGLYGPFYCTMGTIGVITNILNVIALSRSIKLATYKIFLAMSCADFMVMLTFLLYSLSFGVYWPPLSYFGEPGVNLKVSYSFYLWKKVCFLIANPFICISNWCAVLITVFRLLAISMPLKAVRYARPAVINTCIVCVYIFGFAAQIPHWITKRFDEHGALIQVEELEKYAAISLFLNGIIPIGLCTIFTIALVGQLARSRERIHGSIKGEQFEERKKGQRQMSITLVLITIFYIVLNLPSTIYNMMDFTDAFEHTLRFKELQFYIAQNAATVISYACNFFIYILANETFRKDLKYVLMAMCSACLARPLQGQSVGKCVTAATPQTDHSKVESTAFVAASNTSIN